jgi:hypothetical protein
MDEAAEAARTDAEDEAIAGLLRTYPVLGYFAYEHLPQRLQEVSARLAKIAWAMATELPPGAEVASGLRKLLEAKDCFVRAGLR